MRWVPECFGSGDEIKLGAYAVTEPQAGSDVKSLKTTAKRDGDEWVLNGTKVFITNGGIADVHVVVATVDPELGTRGQASFVVGKDTPGLSQGKKETKLGIRASHTAEIVLEDCRDPGREPARRRGEAGEQARARPLRPEVAPGRRAGDLRGDPAAGRRLGARHRPGRLRVDARVPRRRVTMPRDGDAAAADRSGVQQTLADVATEIEAARLLVQRAAWMGRNGVPMTGGQGSMSKLKAGDVTMWATTTLMDLVGPVRQEHRLPAGEVVPRRQDLPAVRGHGRDPAHGHLADAGPASTRERFAESLEAAVDASAAVRRRRPTAPRPRRATAPPRPLP